jgi:hypothetical protein
VVWINKGLAVLTLAGSRTIRARATDDSANRGASSATISVTVQ